MHFYHEQMALIGSYVDFFVNAMMLATDDKLKKPPENRNDMMAPSNGNGFHVTGPLWGKSTDHR